MFVCLVNVQIAGKNDDFNKDEDKWVDLLQQGSTGVTHDDANSDEVTAL